MQDFFAMGGYAFYVWSSFGLAALILLIVILEPLFHHKTALKEADDFHSDESK